MVQMVGLCRHGHPGNHWDTDGIDIISAQRIDELTLRTAAGADPCVGQLGIVEQNPFFAPPQVGSSKIVSTPHQQSALAAKLIMKPEVSETNGFRAAWGIGLSVSKTIIENHQGRVWAERNDGPGSEACFLRSLPDCGGIGQQF
ncbi:hypothetical protein [Mesorhizobium sp. M1403]|uniref:hypothetical protein n=1 Tax=Mesorhizobium sp. M1403 TaxID=2957097 RepID=UPI0033396B6F